MKHSIYNTLIAQMTVPRPEMTSLVEFLVMQRDRIVLPQDASKRLLASRTMTQTPVSRLAARAVELGKDAAFSILSTE